MDIIILLVVWALLGLLTYNMAKSRNRNARLWTAVSLLLSPLISIVVLLLIGTKPKELESKV